jgi:hypothetical protein
LIQPALPTLLMIWPRSCRPHLPSHGNFPGKHTCCVSRAGDQAALSALFDETSPLVFAVALRILSFRADAEEVVVDVYSPNLANRW